MTTLENQGSTRTDNKVSSNLEKWRLRVGRSNGVTNSRIRWPNQRMADNKKRYQAATVFVDHYSQLAFTYMQFSTGAEETVNAKMAFEAFAAQFGVTVRHYHANNGQFSKNMWVKAVNEHRPQQTMSFCGVGAHHKKMESPRRKYVTFRKMPEQ
jgi:hypothetical protein